MSPTTRVLGFCLALICASAWAASANPTIHRRGHTAILLRDGSVLVVGGFNEATDLSTPVVEQFSPWSGWSVLTPLDAASEQNLSGARVVLLPDGKALYVSHGARVFDGTNFIELDGGLLNPDRSDHTLTLLNNGSVLLAGGIDNAIGDAGVTLRGYPGFSNNWFWTPVTSTVPRPYIDRYSHTATSLAGGAVLLAGGSVSPSERAAGYVLFDTATNALSWVDAGVITTRMTNHSATRRWIGSGGEVLLFGDPEAADTDAQLISRAPAFLTTPVGRPGPSVSLRNQHAAVLLPTGQVEIIGGGDTNTFLAEAHMFMPGDAGWRQSAPMVSARKDHTATLLLDGKVLVVGGSDAVGAASGWELRDPVGFSFSIDPAQAPGYSGMTLTPLGTNEMLAVGGEANGPPHVAQRVTNVGLSITLNMAGLRQRVGHTATYLMSEEVLVLGGIDGTVVLDECWLINAAAPAMSRRCAPMFEPRTRHTATMLPGGKILVTGGFNAAGNATDTAWLFDPNLPNGGRWDPVLPKMMYARAEHAAVLTQNGGEVIVTGGTFAPTRGEKYSIGGGTFSSTFDLNVPRFGHTMTLVADGRILVAGGVTNGAQVTSSLEVMVPGTPWVLSVDDAGTNLGEGRSQHVAVAMPTGDVVFAGGGPGVGRGRTASRWSPLTQTLVHTQLASLHRAPGLAVGNLGEVVLVGGHNLSTGLTQTYRIPSQAINSDHSLQTISLGTIAPYNFTFQVQGPWRDAPEASSGDGRNSPVNLPRLVIQRLDNGAVLPLYNYNFNMQTGQFSGALGAVPQGVYRAWAYVSGVPGGAAWFRIGSHVTSPWVPLLDGGASNDGGPALLPDGGVAVSDGGVLVPDGGTKTGYSFNLTLPPGAPYVVGVTIHGLVNFTVPNMANGSELRVKIHGDEGLEARCFVPEQCLETNDGAVVLRYSGTVDPNTVVERAFDLRASTSGFHTVSAELVHLDVVRGEADATFETVVPEVPRLGTGGCGCSASPGVLAAAALLWVLVRRRRRSP